MSSGHCWSNTMLALTLKNILRRPIRTVLTLLALGGAVAFMVCLLAFTQTYQTSLRKEFSGMGLHLMLVPLGCPYDAAAQILKGRTLDTSLPESALASARRDPAVDVAAPVFAAAIPRPSLGRTDLWIGVDEAAPKIRSWWKLKEGSFPAKPTDVLLGHEAAETELRAVGDTLYSPETKTSFTVCGILEQSGTSDDSQFFIPLKTAQTMFKQPGRITGIAIRLRDPNLIAPASARLQEIPGAQAVTMTEMIGTFLNLAGAAKALMLGVTFVALGVSGLTVFNTLVANTLERTRELGVLRAIGYSRSALFASVTSEAVIISIAGTLLGLLLAQAAGGLIAGLVRPLMPLASPTTLVPITPQAALQSLALTVCVGLIAALLPAFRAATIHPVEALRTK